jgi:hypothetical protein
MQANGHEFDCVPFPLYHGTSTLWKQSIQKHGLGGRDVVKELRALEFCRRAVEHLRTVPENYQLNPARQYVIEKICTQDVTQAGFNFRHGGGVYLTPSRFTARQYAQDFGSELVRECRDLHAAVLLAENNLRPQWFRYYRELIATFADPGTPLLIRVDRVLFGELVAENGRSAADEAAPLLGWIAENKAEEERRHALRRAARAGDMEAMLELWSDSNSPETTEQVIELQGQQTNFQSTVTFPASRLHFEEL